MAHIISFPASAQPLGLVDRVKKLFADGNTGKLLVQIGPEP